MDIISTYGRHSPIWPSVSRWGADVHGFVCRWRRWRPRGTGPRCSSCRRSTTRWVTLPDVRSSPLTSRASSRDTQLPLSASHGMLMRMMDVAGAAGAGGGAQGGPGQRRPRQGPLLAGRARAAAWTSAAAQPHARVQRPPATGRRVNFDPVVNTISTLYIRVILSHPGAMSHICPRAPYHVSRHHRRSCAPSLGCGSWRPS